MAFDAFFLILLMLALGMLCRRLFPANAADTLNQFALYVLLPAAILRYASRLSIGAEVLAVAAVPWAVLVATIVCVRLLTRPLKLDVGTRAALMLCIGLGNTSYLGYPLTLALLGDAALPTAVIYDQFGSFLILATWGLWVLARYGGEAPPTPAQSARKVLTFPPFVALVVALTVMPAQPPHAIDAVLLRLSDALLPVVALAVGLQLQLRLPREQLAPLGAGLALKLLLMPLLALGLVALLGLRGLQADAVVLETAMPPMITAGALAISHRLAPTLAAALVGYGTLLSMLTLPLWHWLIG
ncbi:AEC family transporter [Chiayiivirga flava]|nr:AEC family transporter [Chiayiivirga flava]